MRNTLIFQVGGGVAMDLDMAKKNGFERGSKNEKWEMEVRRIKTEAPRSFDSASRIVISSVAEKSLLQNTHYRI